MSRPRGGLGKTLPILLAMAGVAWLRRDLLLEYAGKTLRRIDRGGPLLWKVVAENLLFAAILAGTVRVLSRRARGARDWAAAALALGLGYFAEAWGTRAGLWVYYTGETPPLWILPAWALGAWVIDAVSADLEARAGGSVGNDAYKVAYPASAAAVLAVILVFAPSHAVLLIPLGMGLFWRAEPRRDFWRLAAGGLCVFLADLWGTTNRCWTYHTYRHGYWPGILFGMAFDSALILIALKGAGLRQKD